MEKGRKDKKVEIASQELSSSASSKNNRKRTMDKMDKDNDQKEKKLNKESKTKVQESSINDLPPEMLMKVLKNVDSKSLVGCRLVNRQWNGISSEILQSRPDLQLLFDYSTEDGKFIKYPYQYGETRGKSLSSFTKCFQKSKNFPFAHFWFREIDSSFEQSDWIQFISDLKDNVKGIKLAVHLNASISNSGDLIKLTEKVRDLLLTKLPELEKFGLSLDIWHPTAQSTTIQLFPTSCGENPNSKPSTSKGSKSSGVQLPNLKVLYLEEEMFSAQTGIVSDLLGASVNLQKLESFYNIRFQNINNLLLIQSFGKLSCLQDARIEPVELLLKFQELRGNPSAPLPFKLRKSNINLEILYKNKQLWSEASLFLSNFFESNKDTLAELIMQPLGFLSDLQLPQFSKLVRLSTKEDGYGTPFSAPPVSLLPPGTNPVEIFPVLRSLELTVQWSEAFPDEDYISGIPTLETLKVAGKEMNESCIPQISLMCPNLKEFEISRDDVHPMENFPKVGRAIWTHLKKLQSLVIYVLANVDNHEDAFPAFDSGISGFSEADCKRLYKLLSADKFLKESGSGGKVPKSELKAERKYPSILDLKDLKSFDLHVLCSNEKNDLDFTDLKQVGPTLVSEKCTLDRMDNLDYFTNKIAKD